MRAGGLGNRNNNSGFNSPRCSPGTDGCNIVRSSVDYLAILWSGTSCTVAAVFSITVVTAGATPNTRRPVNMVRGRPFSSASHLPNVTWILRSPAKVFSDPGPQSSRLAPYPDRSGHFYEHSKLDMRHRILGFPGAVMLPTYVRLGRIENNR